MPSLIFTVTLPCFNAWRAASWVHQHAGVRMQEKKINQDFYIWLEPAQNKLQDCHEVCVLGITHSLLRGKKKRWCDKNCKMMEIDVIVEGKNVATWMKLNMIKIVTRINEAEEVVYCNNCDLLLVLTKETCARWIVLKGALFEPSLSSEPFKST